MDFPFREIVWFGYLDTPLSICVIANGEALLEYYVMKAAEPVSTTASNSLDLPPFPATRAASKRTREELDRLLTAKIGKYASEDTSVVVFGSLARGEWTSRSDLDWTYLIDGQANSDHMRIAQEIRRVIGDNPDLFRPPGQTGTFGNMAFSHDIIHQIGGQHDTNKNTTQRILLLLESAAIGRNIQAHDRVIRGVVNRYLEEDTHLLSHDSKSYRVPRFLLNDIVRFWRTMAVDFASKQRDRAGAGWGLRNAKLRMSRKLIFASGLLICFSANLDPDLQKKISTETSTGNDAIKLNLVNYIRELVRLTPLETLDRIVKNCDVSAQTAEQLFSAYAEFLSMLGDEATRNALDALRAKDSRTDKAFQRIRKISEQFEVALSEIFFGNPRLAPLTRKYGVF
jgi:predicted nucleotidyltransferase